MYKKSKKLLSIVLTASIICSNLGAFTASAAVPSNPENNTNIVNSAFSNIDVTKFSDPFKTISKDEAAKGKAYEKSLYKPEDKVRLIVQLDKKSVQDYAQGKSLQQAAQDKVSVDKVTASQAECKNQIKKINKDVKFKNTFTLLMNGFSMEANYADKEKIEKLPGVKGVYVARQYQPEMNNAVKMTGVDKVWQELGLKGEGTVVAIIDSGINYKHKAMKLTDTSKAKLSKASVENMNKTIPNAKGQFFTDKVPYGYNFADESEEVISLEGTPAYGHGMHVGGIVAANDSDEDILNSNGIKGVAPEAQLLAMKVFPNNPNGAGGTTDVLVAAIEDSVAHGADVINMSLGDPLGGYPDADEPERLAIKEAVEHGTIVCCSAGNNTYASYPNRYKGQKDYGIVGAPGQAHESIQVAAYENDVMSVDALSYKIGNETGKMPYIASEGEYVPCEILKGDYLLVNCGKGYEEDFEGKDLTGKIALVERGGKTPEESFALNVKIKNAQAKNAAGVIIYNQESNGDNWLPSIIENNPSQGIYGINIPAGIVRRTDGLKLLNNIGNDVSLSFAKTIASVTNPYKGEMCYFSSWGPTADLDFKPNIAGIGGNVTSTYGDGYLNQNGTSMASPYVAGVMALIKQHENKLLTFNDVKKEAEFSKALAMNTATVKIDARTGFPYSPRCQGAGLVNAKAAIDNNVTVTYNGEAAAALKSMGKTTEFTMTLHNYGTTDVTYNVGDINGVLTEVDEDINVLPHETKMQGATIAYDKQQVIVKVGQDAQVKATITMDDSATRANFAEGFIRFTPVDTSVPEIGMPFMGFYGDWGQDLAIFDKPTGDKDSIYNENTLAYGVPSWLPGIKDLTTLGANMPEHTGFNPEGKTVNNVVPSYTFLRYAKDFKVNITDANGKALRQIYTKDAMYKIVPSKVDREILGEKNCWNDAYNCFWDGKLFDSTTGKEVTAPEGQYYITATAKAFGDNTKDQTFINPVKIDKTAPTVTILDEKVSTSLGKDVTIKFKVKDNQGGTGENVVLFDIGGKLYSDGYDANWNKKNYFFLNRECEYNAATDTYSFTMKGENLPNTADEKMSGITAAVVDYAGNVGSSESCWVKYDDVFYYSINIKMDKAVYEVGEDVKLTYSVPEKELPLVDHYDIEYAPDPNRSWEDIRVNNGKNTEFTVPGSSISLESYNWITVYAVDANGNDIDEMFVTAPVNDLSCFELHPGFINDYETFTSKNLRFAASLSNNHVESLKVNGEDVPLGMETTMGFDGLWFEKNIQLESGKVNIIHIEAVSSDKNADGSPKFEKIDYSYHVMYDPDAPVITLTNPNSQENYTEVLANGEDTTYKVKGTVKDNGRGYKLFVNKNNILNVDKGVPVPGSSNEKEFEYDVPLNDGQTMINVEAVDFEGNTVTKTIRVTKISKLFSNTVVTDKNDAKLGDVVTVTMDTKGINAQLSPEATANYVRLENGKATVDVKPVVLSLADGKYVGKINLDNTWKNGMWRIQDISIKNENGAETIFTNPDLNGAIDYTFGKASFNIAPTIPTRYGGADRFETAVKVSTAGWTTSQNVILANAYGFADSLAGVPFAYLKDAPILLTEVNSIPKATSDEITRLGAKNIYILGGTGVVSKKIEDELKNNHFNVVRLAGADRFDTGLEIAKEVMKNNSSKTAVLTTAYNFPDALAISPYAAMNQYPILYTHTNTLNAKSKAFIKENGITKIIIPGGAGAVSEAVANELKNSGITVERISGTDRYTTSLNIAKQYKASFKSDVMLSNGNNFPDALVGGVLAAKKQVPILLVDTNSINNDVKEYIRSNGNINMYLLGGTGVISDNILKLINQ